MPTLRQIEEARAGAPLVAQSITAADTDVAMVVQYVPSLGTGGAAATCQVITATGLVFTVDAAACAGDDLLFGDVTTIAFATYTTLGAVVDAINGSRAWRAILVGGARHDLSTSKLLAAAGASCIGDNGLEILHDSSSTDHMSLAISGEQFVNNGKNGHKKDADGVENWLHIVDIVPRFTGAGTLKFYAEAQTGGGETSVTPSWTQIGPSYTLTSGTQVLAGTATAPLIGPVRNKRIIARFAAATTVETETVFNVTSKSAVLTADRLVSTAPNQ